MNKFYSFLLILVVGCITTDCGGGSSGNSSATTESSVPAWQTVGNSLPISNIAFNSIVVANNGTIYVGGSADVNNGLVLNNTANGGNWQLVSDNYIPPAPFFESVTEQVGALAISSTNVIYASVNTSYSASVLMYNDLNTHASSWQNSLITVYLPGSGIINSLAIDSANTVYAATGVNYAVSSNNQPNFKGNVYAIPVGAFMPTRIGLGSAPDDGAMNSILVENGAVYVASGGYTIASDGSTSYFGDVYSADSGGIGAWQRIGGSGTPDNGVANSIAIANDSIYVATSNGNVYKSPISAGGVWSAALGGEIVPDGSAINSLAVTNSGKIYAATALGNIYTIINSHWQQIGGGTVPDDWAINAIAVHGTQLYAATQGGHVYVVTLS